MTSEALYQRAWELLLKRVQSKPRARWSIKKLCELMLACLIEAGRHE